MKTKMESQQGFLLIVAIILIVIVSFIGGTLAYMYIGGSKSNTNILRSNDAFYVATSGLEIAKRDIMYNSVYCEAINDIPKYTDATFPPGSADPTGYFTVTASANIVTNLLAQDILADTTEIPLIDATGFLPTGQVFIKNEKINYFGIQGNILQNAKRGVEGTVAKKYNATPNQGVIQQMCILTSTGQVPTTTNPEGKRVVQEQLMLGGYRYLAPGQSLPNLVLPPIVGVKKFKIEDNSTTVNNLIDGYTGCVATVVGDLDLHDSPTLICNNDPVYSSYATTVWSDNVNPPSPAIDIVNFYDYFFAKPITTLVASGYQADKNDLNTINNIITPGQPGYGMNVVWVDGDVNLDGHILLDGAPNVKTVIVLGNLKADKASGNKIGSAAVPVKIIVDGQVEIKKSTEIYGFLYATDKVKLVPDNGEAVVLNGAIASEGDVEVKKGAQIIWTTAIADKLGSLPTRIQSIPEVFN